MKGDSFKTCRYCGKRIGIITEGIYRKVIVDEEAVRVVADPRGQTFVRVDGSKVIGIPASLEDERGEYAYRPHRRSCGVTE